MKSINQIDQLHRVFGIVAKRNDVKMKKQSSMMVLLNNSRENSFMLWHFELVM